MDDGNFKNGVAVYGSVLSDLEMETINYYMKKVSGDNVDGEEVDIGFCVFWKPNKNNMYYMDDIIDKLKKFYNLTVFCEKTKQFSQKDKNISVINTREKHEREKNNNSNPKELILILLNQPTDEYLYEINFSNCKEYCNDGTSDGSMSSMTPLLTSFGMYYQLMFLSNFLKNYKNVYNITQWFITSKLGVKISFDYSSLDKEKFNIPLNFGSDVLINDHFSASTLDLFIDIFSLDIDDLNFYFINNSFTDKQKEGQKEVHKEVQKEKIRESIIGITKNIIRVNDYSIKELIIVKNNQLYLNHKMKKIEKYLSNNGKYYAKLREKDE